jgi:hypothetical protein
MWPKRDAFIAPNVWGRLLNPIRAAIFGSITELALDQPTLFELTKGSIHNECIRVAFHEHPARFV